MSLLRHYSIKSIVSRQMIVNIELGEDLQLEYQSWLDVKESLGIERSINNFLYYTYNYGTFANPRNPDDNEPGTE